MSKRINYEVKEKIVSLSGACFWYWSSFYSFLDSCGIPRAMTAKYPKDAFNKYEVTRNILNILEETNQVDLIENLVSNFYKLRNAQDRDNLDENKAKQLLNEFRDLVGDDPIENEIRKITQKKARENYEKSVNANRHNTSRLAQMNSVFVRLATSNELTHQQRGYELENLFCDLLQFCEFDYDRPYKTSDGEQIDGHFNFEKFDYLIEAKWTDSPTKQLNLSVFDGKIRGKAQSTRGLFLSANGFDENAIKKFSGDSPRIILMTGEDLAMILNGRVLLYDALKAKVDAIVRYGNINFPVRKIAS